MNYLGKKIGTLIITLLIVSFVTFLAFEIIPGDSALASLGMNASKEQVEALREELGLNQSILVRYTNWLKGALLGDFGESLSYDMPVKALLRERFLVTVGLAILSIILITVSAIPLGILSAKKQGGLIDRFIYYCNQIGMAIPPFFLGMILTLIFGIILKWFVPGKYIAISESFFGNLKYLLFPAIAIAIPKIGMLTKFLRSSLLRQGQMDYVRTAKSKGNTENGVFYGHMLKNALIPVITFFAMIIADVLAGSIIVEQVFNLPGIGRLLVVAISNRDFAVVQAIVLYIASVVIIMNFIVDVLYQYVDPRVRIEV